MTPELRRKFENGDDVNASDFGFVFTHLNTMSRVPFDKNMRIIKCTYITQNEPRDDAAAAAAAAAAAGQDNSFHSGTEI